MINQENVGVTSYPHVLHRIPISEVTKVSFYGGLEMSFAGFGGADLTPAPEVGFNLTFACPEGIYYLLLIFNNMTFYGRVDFNLV